MTSTGKLIVIDPSSKHYYEDRLFDASDVVLNRDDTLAPFVRLKLALESKGIAIHTADLRNKQLEFMREGCDYYSLGVLNNFRQLDQQGSAKLKAFLILEPPVVAPSLYRSLPELTSAFEFVYVHNTEGDGYSLKGVDQSKLRKLYWPQPRADVIEHLWLKADRECRIVMINGNHKPKSFEGELYSKRIEVMVELAKFGAIDLYGRGWEKWWSPASQWMPYWRNRKTLMSIYKGACRSKYEVMSNYTFALCFENMAMKGYVTEKIFDCFYAGTIPLYLGAKDVTDLIPPDAYIDYRRFDSSEHMLDEITKLSNEQIQSMREAGRAFIRGSLGMRYYNSMVDIVNV